MAECDWAILCDYAFKDVGRKTCMIGIFDRIFAASVPAQQHQAAFVFKLTGDASEKAKWRIEIARPTGGLLGSIGGEVQLPEIGSADFIANLQGMPLPDWGLYSFSLYLGETLAKTVSVNVAQVPTPPRGQGDAP